MNKNQNKLTARLMGIHTHQQLVVYMRKDCHICLSEGYDSHVRLLVEFDSKKIIADLNVVELEMLDKATIGFNYQAWKKLGLTEGDEIIVSHAPIISSLKNIRAKIFNKPFGLNSLSSLINDIKDGRLTDIEISSFLTICAGGRLSQQEIIYLTQAMVQAGEQLSWPFDVVVDKHCIGGLPGNRTTPIVVAIVAANGLYMPKTSSRAITSPAGTADTMETITNVALSIEQIKQVVLESHGCLAWGGSVNLSPADDILIRIEKALDVDSEGQLIASVLSKKIAAGSTHVLIDIPVGATAKVRSQKDAQQLSQQLINVGAKLGLQVETMISDGSQPVGFGIGPMLEAHDVLAVLQNADDAPTDLADRAVKISAKILELSGQFPAGTGLELAKQTLLSHQAYKKFKQICLLQGGIKPLRIAKYQHSVLAQVSGIVTNIDNRRLARLAKLSGAPKSPAAGIKMNCKLQQLVNKDEILYVIHAQSSGELEYALSYLSNNQDIITIGEKL